MSDNNAVPNSEVVPNGDENPQGESAPKVNPILPLVEKMAENKRLKPISLALEAAAESDRFKVLMQELGLYQTDSNADEVAKLQKQIDDAKKALVAAGFAENSDIVKGAIKGLSAELTKTQGKVKDNLGELAEYFGLKIGKTPRVTEANGQLAMHRPNLAELKANDWYYKEGENTGIVVHSMSISENALAGLGIKPASDTWVVFSYNGELQVKREKDSEGTRYMAELTQIPENWLGAKPLNFINLDKLTLSGFIGKVAQSYGKQYHGNGWQGAAQLAEQFSGIERVVREA